MKQNLAGIRLAIVVCGGLGLMALLGVLGSHLALTDIWHGEGDLSTEWKILRMALLTVLAFILVTFATLFRVWKFIGQPRP